MYRKVITMTAWRRPKYTKQVVDNLKRCIGFDEYILLPTIEPGHPEVLKVYSELSNCKVVVNNKILGCPTNTLKALKRGFEISDFVIHLEDDTAPGIDSLKYFEWVYKTYKDDKDVFTAAAYNKVKEIKPKNYFTVFRHRWFNPWMWSTWIDRFEEMVKKWNFTAWGPNLNHNVRKNRCEIMPHLSRSQNIGEHSGTYNNPSYWRQRQYNPIWVNSIPNISFENLSYAEHTMSQISKDNKFDTDDIKAYVTEGYRKILRRDPDSGGLSHYIAGIYSGRITKQRFLEILRTSQEYRTKFGNRKKIIKKVKDNKKR